MTGAMDVPTPPNHHAHHPGFHGLMGWVGALTMVAGRRPVARVAADLVGVSAGDHVVDVGCGPGAAAREAAGRGARVTAVDPSDVMRRAAHWTTGRGAERRIRWVDGVAEALPLDDGEVTVVWSLSTVHHWADVEQGLAEAARVLASGGRFLATERQRDPEATGLASHGWTPAQAEAFAECCRAAGFVDVTVRTPEGRRGRLLAVRAVRP